MDQQGRRARLVAPTFKSTDVLDIKLGLRDSVVGGKG